MKTLFFVVLLMMCATCVFATEKHNTPAPSVAPALKGMSADNWGGAEAHVLVSAVLGAASKTFVFKEPVKAWGLAMVPGLVKEIDTYYNRPEPGYKHGLFSVKDMIANSVGAAIGVGVGGVIVDKTDDRYRIVYFKEF